MTSSLKLRQKAKSESKQLLFSLASFKIYNEKNKCLEMKERIVINCKENSYGKTKQSNRETKRKREGQKERERERESQWKLTDRNGTPKSMVPEKKARA